MRTIAQIFVAFSEKLNFTFFKQDWKAFLSSKLRKVYIFQSKLVCNSKETELTDKIRYWYSEENAIWLQS